MSHMAPSTRWAICSIGAFLLFSGLVVTEQTLGATPYPLMLLLVALLLPVTAVGAFRLPVERPPRLMVVTLASFVLLTGYAFVSALVADLRIGTDDGAFVELPKAWVLQVPVQSLAVCLMAFLGVVLVRTRDLLPVLWWFAAIGAALTPLGWLLTTKDLTIRLATALGGAAVLHVALLIGLAIALAGWRLGYRPRASAVLTVVFALYVMLSQSRAGLIALGLFAVLVSAPRIVRSVRSGALSRRAVGLAGALVAILAVMVAFVLGRRGFDPTGGGRVGAWVDGVAAATSSPLTVVFGTGYGTLWPWMAFERGGFQADAGPQKAMPHAETLAHAHNVFVAIGAEMGLVGLALFLPVVLAVVWCYWRASTPLARLLGAALVATLAGFLFDTYLIKNFPLAMVWWCTLFVTIRLVARPPASVGGGLPVAAHADGDLERHEELGGPAHLA